MEKLKIMSGSSGTQVELGGKVIQQGLEGIDFYHCPKEGPAKLTLTLNLKELKIEDGCINDDEPHDMEIVNFGRYSNIELYGKNFGEGTYAVHLAPDGRVSLNFAPREAAHSEKSVREWEKGMEQAVANPA